MENKDPKEDTDRKDRLGRVGISDKWHQWLPLWRCRTIAPSTNMCRPRQIGVDPVDLRPTSAEKSTRHVAAGTECCNCHHRLTRRYCDCRHWHRRSRDASNTVQFSHTVETVSLILSTHALNEPSISYKDFMDRMKAGEVSYVEFRAPDVDVAYATVKGQERPIRIGEGYPIEQHDGYSSPAFAIRAVKNAGVPYKFVVPGLQKYSSS